MSLIKNKGLVKAISLTIIKNYAIDVDAVRAIDGDGVQAFTDK